METIKFEINERCNAGKAIKKIPNNGILESIKDFKKGKIIQAENALELLKKLKS